MHSSDQIDHQETEGGTRALRAEADALRRKLRSDERSAVNYRYPTWRKTVYLAVLVGSIAGATTLLILDGVRYRLVEKAVLAGLSAARPEGQAEVFELPPPPPKETEPRVMVGAPIIMSSGDDEGIVLYSDSAPSITSGGTPVAEEEQEFTAPEVTSATQEAYQLLLNESSAMGQLVDGSLQGYQFQEWQAVQNEPPRFVIDLLALRASDKQEVHLIWEINLQEGEVRPLSQAARDLVVQQGPDN